jgi:hypothetical protein
MERKKNWEWSIEQNERWQAKMDESKAKADSSFHSESESAYFQISLPSRFWNPRCLCLYEPLLIF